MTWGRSELRSFKRRSWEDYMDCDGDLAAAAAVFLNIFLSDSFWFVCRMRNRLAFPPFNATGWGSNQSISSTSSTREDEDLSLLLSSELYGVFVRCTVDGRRIFIFIPPLPLRTMCFCLVLIVSNPLHLLYASETVLVFLSVVRGDRDETTQKEK